MKPRQNMCSHLISSSSFFGFFFFAILLLRDSSFFTFYLFGRLFYNLPGQIQGRNPISLWTNLTTTAYICYNRAVSNYPLRAPCRRAGSARSSALCRRISATASAGAADSFKPARGHRTPPTANNTPPPPAAQHKHKQAPLCNHFPTSTQTGASSEIPSIYSCWPSSCSPSPPPWAPWWTAS